jgi:hypothetical protein
MKYYLGELDESIEETEQAYTYNNSWHEASSLSELHNITYEAYKHFKIPIRTQIIYNEQWERICTMSFKCTPYYWMMRNK